MFSSYLSMFLPSYPKIVVYMLQSTEYQTKPYLKWYWRTTDFRSVMKRRVIHRTKAANLLLKAITFGMLCQIAIGIVLLALGFQHHVPAFYWLAASLFVSYPLLWGHLVVVPLVLGRLLIIKPRERRQIAKSRAIFANHPGIKIAVAGSYGKTSMKELLLTVLSEGKKVTATPANKNVAASHAIFAAGLKGDEDIIIIEYGEGGPGDVVRFVDTTRPSIGIITGLAPAHLDHYPTLEAAGKDIFALADYVGADQAYVNGESAAAKPFIKPDYHVYDRTGVLGWRVSNIKISYDGTSFEMTNDSKRLKLHSGLLGKHQVGPLALAASLALKLGLTTEEVEQGIAQTAPFEHRMRPRNLNGAWIIDDTYNGNIDGIKAGLELLGDLPAQRKVYVTPGLVDQGVENEKVHMQMGELIAKAKPDNLVLMKNSAAKYIQQGLRKGGYQGDVRIETEPLKFYTNIDHFLAHGDLVMMQNDWTDNYN